MNPPSPELAELHDQARATWGDAAATTLMDHLPPAVDQLVTKDDLHAFGIELGAQLRTELRQDVSALSTELRSELREDLRSFRTELREDMRALRTDVTAEIGGLRSEMGELRSEVGGLRGEIGGLHAGMGDIRKEIHTTTMHLVTAFIATTVTLMVAMFALVVALS